MMQGLHMCRLKKSIMRVIHRTPFDFIRTCGGTWVSLEHIMISCYAHSRVNTLHLHADVICAHRSLAGNSLTGTLPSQLGTLTSLTFMCV